MGLGNWLSPKQEVALTWGQVETATTESRPCTQVGFLPNQAWLAVHG